ncbi:MAG: leucine-rich repeat domain-containing protein [Prevotellaceae bacterium]|jgi:hypothetical protein|nr:leucine-rich repeat domain-containing protein [Prevotellaceae bacterium]
MELVLHRRYLGKEYTVGSLYFHLSPNPSPQRGEGGEVKSKNMEKDNLCSKAETTSRMIDRNSHKNKNQTNHKNHSSDSNRIKQISFLLFILCFFATNKITAQTSGYTNSCKWELTGTSPNYTLTISPTNGISGAMADYTSGSAPWYSNRANIKTLIIQQGVTHIVNYAFYDCQSLTGSLTIPNSVTSIGNSAFDGCRGFTGSLTIPNSVTSIEEYAFYYCTGMTSLTIGNSVKTIRRTAFRNCANLTNVIIPNCSGISM